MFTKSISSTFALIGASLFLGACNDEPAAPKASAPSYHAAQLNVVALSVEPFTFRAPLDPYKILQLPDFMIHSRERTDVVMQRLVFSPGPGGWHTHPGPTVVIVLEGRIKLTRFSEKTGCVDTEDFSVGQAYFEEGNEVHRAVVVSSESAVLLVTRFNIPVGGPISTPVVPAPVC